MRTMGSKQVKAFLKDEVIAIAGPLGGVNWAEAKVAHWVKLYGGRFSPDLDDSVTHVLCSPEDWAKKTPRGKI
jgi:hypothetical protein